ncbi:uncharacterized protein RJT20DRAFT_130130 [Scheffersomyces xylosifermentans]|uniref:uncharacterized protein n=1 Tax=Scheffersomyces xylosifermentans TaxID=1304137 RepID=UPI00315D7FAD
MNMKHSINNQESEVSPPKKIKKESKVEETDELEMLFQDFSDVVPQFPESTTHFGDDEEINQVLSGFISLEEMTTSAAIPSSQIQTGTEQQPFETNPVSNSASSEDSSPFDSPETIITFPEMENSKNTKQQPKEAVVEAAEVPINKATVLSIKQSMVNTSKLVSLFTTLKVTYLKLCKEFNYLLRKFNENEKIKIELINENNELRKLLTEIITDREVDKRKYKAIEKRNDELKAMLAEQTAQPAIKQE